MFYRILSEKLSVGAFYEDVLCTYNIQPIGENKIRVQITGSSCDKTATPTPLFLKVVDIQSNNQSCMLVLFLIYEFVENIDGHINCNKHGLTYIVGACFVYLVRDQSINLIVLIIRPWKKHARMRF